MIGLATALGSVLVASLLMRRGAQIGSMTLLALLLYALSGFLRGALFGATTPDSTYADRALNQGQSSWAHIMDMQAGTLIAYFFGFMFLILLLYGARALLGLKTKGSDDRAPSQRAETAAIKLPGSLAAGAFIGLVIGAAATSFVLSSLPAGDGAAVTGAERGGRTGGGAGGRGGFAPAVSMAAVEAASVGKTLDVIGEGRSLKSVTLTSEATGLVTEVNIASGKKVAMGDILLRLDDEQQRIALDRARAQYPIAKENSERYASLAKTEAASSIEAEAAFNNFKSVEADLRAAQFAVQQRSIRAPFDGVIGLTEIEVGEYLRAGDVVTTLDDTSSLIVEFSVPQEAANAVEIGQPVTARLASGSGRVYAGRINAIDSRIDPTSRTLKIEAVFENEDNALLPGAIFAISTTSSGEAAVSIPGLAIQWDRSGPYVWKRDEDGAALRASVEILQRTDNIVLVSGDIMPGDVIVFEGADRVRSGMPLPGLMQQDRPRQSGGANAATSGAASGNH